MSLITLPAQPIGTPWPTHDWPHADLPKTMRRAPFDALVDEAFAAKHTPTLGETHALLIVQNGRIIFERYGEGFDARSTHHSWSKAKSITHALIGLLVKDGTLDIHAPADVPEWKAPGDPRGKISLDHLLRMSSGLKFIEDYAPGGGPSDVIAMLFNQGKQDVAAFAAALPLAHEPNSFWSYASGTTNIVARCAARALDAYGEDFKRFMFARLFEPLGMTSPLPRFDKAGTFIGSSYCFATARDFARFGLLYMRGGVWDGRQILPPGWAEYARTPTWQQPGEALRYGAHWWLDIAGPGSFSANGYDGQYTIVAPDRDLILVRHGKTPLELKDNLSVWIRQVAACFT